MERIKITWKHSPREVREEMSRRTEVDKWKGDDRWWQEFLDARARFLKSKEIPKLVEDFVQLEAEFGEWVKESEFWWGGDWARSKDLAVWHVRRYTKTRKKPGKSVSSNYGNPTPSTSRQSPTPFEVASQQFFDPVLNKFRQI